MGPGTSEQDERSCLLTGDASNNAETPTCPNLAHHDQQLPRGDLQVEVAQQGSAILLPGEAAVPDQNGWGTRGCCWLHRRLLQLEFLQKPPGSTAL